MNWHLDARYQPLLAVGHNLRFVGICFSTIEEPPDKATNSSSRPFLNHALNGVYTTRGSRDLNEFPSNPISCNYMALRIFMLFTLVPPIRARLDTWSPHRGER